jgi:hypothetical protein
MAQRNRTVRQADTTGVPALSAKLSSVSLPLAEVVYALTDRTIDARESWLMWPQVEQLQMWVDLLKSALLEADDRGEYRPEGRPVLREAA